MHLSLKIEGYTEGKNEGGHPEHGQARQACGFNDDDFSRHRNQGHFKDDPDVDAIFLDVCLQHIQQLDADQDQQEKRKDIEQALHRDEKPRRLPDLFCNQETQMRGGKHHNQYEQKRKHKSNQLLNLGQQSFHVVSIRQSGYGRDDIYMAPGKVQPTADREHSWSTGARYEGIPHAVVDRNLGAA